MNGHLRLPGLLGEMVSLAMSAHENIADQKPRARRDVIGDGAAGRSTWLRDVALQNVSEEMLRKPRVQLVQKRPKNNANESNRIAARLPRRGIGEPKKVYGKRENTRTARAPGGRRPAWRMPTCNTWRHTVISHMPHDMPAGAADWTRDEKCLSAVPCDATDGPDKRTDDRHDIYQHVLVQPSPGLVRLSTSGPRHLSLDLEGRSSEASIEHDRT